MMQSKELLINSVLAPNGGSRRIQSLSQELRKYKRGGAFSPVEELTFKEVVSEELFRVIETKKPGVKIKEKTVRRKGVRMELKNCTHKTEGQPIQRTWVKP
jgi:hypothetical protein